MKQRYFFTPAMDDVIRQYYDRKRIQPKLSAKRCLEKKLGIPGWACIKRAKILGLSRTKESPWSQAELLILESHAGKVPKIIQAHLCRAGFKRTETAIVLQRKRKMGGVRQNLPFYSAWQVANNLGCDVHKVTGWIRLGWLSAQRRGTERTEKQGGDMWSVYPSALREFLFAHPLEFDIRRVDQLWFMDVVADGALARRRAA